MADKHNILKKYWGYDAFRPLQEDIIDAVLHNEHCIALLPTGGGKSICYQVPALLKEGVCLVISPLIALIEDQINSLHKKGIEAVAMQQSSKPEDVIRIFDTIKYKNIKFIYLSPEKLDTPLIQEKLKQLNISTIAIDEAHCISEWGHDFRPAYLKINHTIAAHPKASVIALTATATNAVIEDIKKQLQINKHLLFKKSFKRENLAYQVFEVEDKFFKIRQILEKIAAPTIIYTNTRNETKKTSEILNNLGYQTTYYHSGLSNEEKQTAYQNWFSEKTPVMVATNAFGMGIDKPNIRVVIHLKPPKSIENYVQEAGRGGRDGKKSFAVMLLHKSDVNEVYNQHQERKIDLDFIRNFYLKLNQYFKIPYGELADDIYEYDSNVFANKYNLHQVKCNEALQLLENHQIVNTLQPFQKQTTFKFMVDSYHLINYKERKPHLNLLIEYILRTFTGVYENENKINEFFVAKKLNVPFAKIIQWFSEMHEDEIIHYKQKTKNTEIQFLVPREDKYTINIISKSLKKQLTNKDKKIVAMLQFANNTKHCRSQLITNYFNEAKSEKCGICDVCLDEKKKSTPPNKSLTKAIYLLIGTNPDIDSQKIVLELKAHKELEILAALKTLLEDKKITATNLGYRTT